MEKYLIMWRQREEYLSPNTSSAQLLLLLHDIYVALQNVKIVTQR